MGAQPTAPSLKSAFLFWLKLGFISFGGPAGQIAIMHRELVEQRRWISEERFLHALNYCMLLPGPEAQQLATYIGWLLHRTWGGLIAGALFVLPSLLILIGLAWIYLNYGDVPLVAGLLYGIKPAVVAIVLHATYRIGGRTLKNGLLAAIALASFIAIYVFAAPFPAVVASAALIGYVGGRMSPHLFTAGKQEKAPGADSTPPVELAEHTQFKLSRTLVVLAVAAVLWLLPIAALTSQFGWTHAYTQMGWFFTKAALLTFGGAYAVLPYISQAAVGHYGWLSATEMIDGLALGETTPGPLIIVVAFVGFVGGYAQPLMGIDGGFWPGVMGAVIVTWFSFLPSFTFIFAGAPLVETSSGNLAITAPLTAITAAVVGVILNLAAYFAVHVFWPTGLDGAFDAISAAIALIGVLLLFRFPSAVIPVLLASALAGLLSQTAFG